MHVRVRDHHTVATADFPESPLNVVLLVLGESGVLAVIIAVIICSGGGSVVYDPNAPDRSRPG